MNRQMRSALEDKPFGTYCSTLSAGTNRSLARYVPGRGRNRSTYSKANRTTAKGATLNRLVSTYAYNGRNQRQGDARRVLKSNEPLALSHTDVPREHSDVPIYLHMDAPTEMSQTLVA